MAYSKTQPTPNGFVVHGMSNDIDKLVFVDDKFNGDNRPELGERITTNKRMVRRFGGKYGNDVTWGSMKSKPMEGIYAGYRILQEGRICRTDIEGGYFEQESTVKCALIIQNERTNPIRIPFSAIKLLEEIK